MKHLKPVPIQRSLTPSGDAGLVNLVRRLADCLAQSNDLGGHGQVHAHLEAARDALAAARETENIQAWMAGRIAELEQLSMTDELTGLLNRRGFQAEMNHAMARAGRYHERGVLIYVDLDAFKPINDTFGHPAGDAVLQRVAWIMSETVRDTDCIGRLGGDEFAVLLVRTSWRAGLDKADAIGRLLNCASVTWRRRMIRIQASLGFQCYGPDSDCRELMDKADDAMYRTKKLRSKLAVGASTKRASA